MSGWILNILDQGAMFILIMFKAVILPHLEYYYQV